MCVCIIVGLCVILVFFMVVCVVDVWVLVVFSVVCVCVMLLCRCWMIFGDLVFVVISGSWCLRLVLVLCSFSWCVVIWVLVLVVLLVCW